jgi:hypothetical protein
MAAGGGRVITTTFGPKTAEALAAISPAILGVPSELGPLVDALRDAAAAPRPTDAPLDVPADWDEALATVMPWVRERIAELRAS